MAAEPRVQELLLQWEELREEGQSVSAAELCKDCPEFLEEVGRQIAVLEGMAWMERPSLAGETVAPQGNRTI